MCEAAKSLIQEEFCSVLVLRKSQWWWVQSQMNRLPRFTRDSTSKWTELVSPRLLSHMRSPTWRHQSVTSLFILTTANRSCRWCRCLASVGGTGPSSWAGIGRWHPAGSWHQLRERELLSTSVSYSPAGDWDTAKHKQIQSIYNICLLVCKQIKDNLCTNLALPSDSAKKVQCAFSTSIWRQHKWNKNK